MVYSCKLADIFTRTVIIDKNFKTFSELWKKSGVRGIVFQFSDVMLTSVSQRQAEERGKFFSSNRQNVATQLIYWIWYPAKRTNKILMPDERILKRRRIYLDNDIITSPSIVSISVATHNTSNEIQCCLSRQSQHSALRDSLLKYIQVLELSATNVAEGFDSRGHALIKDIFTSFNIPSYSRNGLLSAGTHFYKSFFDSSQYYNRRNLQSSENLFDSVEYYNGEHISLNTLSQQQLLENTDFSISSKTSNFDTQFPENLF